MRNDEVFRSEFERLNNMVNYWLGYAAGIKKLTEPDQTKKGQKS